MATHTAFALLQDKENAQRLGEALENIVPEPMGVGVFELEDGSGLWEVGGYFEDPPDEIALALLAAAYQSQGFTISELPQTDWVAKVRRSLAPVWAGRFFVYGSHDSDKIPQDKTVVPLLIEASMAFGTGHHNTTQGCLRALDYLIAQGLECRNVIDIGCGTAVLAMAAAFAWPHPVIAADIDPVAIDVAQANIDANGLTERLRCFVAPGFNHEDIQNQAPYDLVFANILKSPLIDLAPDMAAQVAVQGHAILSGILQEQAQDVLDAYDRVGFTLIWREDIGEWSNLIVQRRAG